MTINISNLTTEHRAILAAAKLPASTLVGDAASEVRNRKLLAKVRNAANRAKVTNPRTAGTFSAVTITDTGATLPSWATGSSYLFNTTTTSIFHSVGGRLQGAGGIKSATLDAANTSVSNSNRNDFIFSGSRIVVRVAGTTAPYRIMVDGAYVATANRFNNFYTLVTSGNVYLTLDFGSFGTRRITVEGMQTAYTIGAYTDVLGKCHAVDLTSAIHITALGDSFVQGTATPSATGGNYADGPFTAMGDYLGAYMTNSGSGGTGWAQSSTGVYRFDERIVAGDLALGLYAPDVIVTMASINDAFNGQNFATVQANALAGLTAARAQYPTTPIVVLGCVPSPSKNTANILSSEAAVSAAVDQRIAAGDKLIRFVPIASDPTGAWVTGSGAQAVFTTALTAATSGTLETAWSNTTGSYTLMFSDGTTKSVTLTQNSTAVSWTGAVTANRYVAAYAVAGNCAWVIAQDYSHVSEFGSPWLGRRYADGVLSALEAMLG